jgi:thiamine biosynthesis lipoprotein
VPRVALALAGLLLGACSPPEERFHAERIVAMGTFVDVVVEVPDPAHRTALVRDIQAFLRRFERDYYAWADGELARLNQSLERGEALRVTPELADLLRATQRYSEQSNGALEPGIGALVELWGFHDGAATPGVPPDPAAIAAWVERDTGVRNLEIAPDGTVTRPRGPAFMLDLGAVGKGAALDHIVTMLRAAGVVNALINTGGNVRVLGTRDGRPWRIGIRAPRADTILGVVELASGESIATSGDYERFYDYAGKRMHHILDPRTGYPVTHTQATTVVAADGTLADAASTALFVAGPEEWREVAQALGVAMVLRVDASGEIDVTPAMRDRLQTDGYSDSPIIVLGQ